MELSGEHELVARARAWVAEVHPHARHLERTLEWVLILEPEASLPLRLAAITHDIERAFAPEDPALVPAPTSPLYNDWHQERSMRVMARWLADHRAPPELTAEVAALVRVHETGGWPEADLLQAADSLSFLEIQVELFADRVRRGLTSPDDAEHKFRWMYDRIRLPAARALAAPLLDSALARVGEISA